MFDVEHYRSSKRVMSWPRGGDELFHRLGEDDGIERQMI